MPYVLYGAQPPYGLGIAAHGCTANCYPPGGELDADGDCCCPDDDWSNLTYSMIKGPESLQRHNEKRVRHALSLLPPTAVENLAYDTGAAEHPLLAAGLVRAARNFHALYPWERWTKYPCQVPSPNDCQDCYSVWRQAALDTTKDDVRSALVDIGLEPPKVPLIGVRLRPVERDAINAVPGGGLSEKRSTMPRRDQLLTVVSNKVAPAAWTKTFLDVFAPKWEQLRIPGGRAALTKVRLPTFKPPREVMTMTVEDAPQPMAPKVPWWLFGIAGALSVAAVGAYAVKKR